MISPVSVDIKISFPVVKLLEVVIFPFLFVKLIELPSPEAIIFSNTASAPVILSTTIFPLFSSSTVTFKPLSPEFFIKISF